MRDSDCGPGGGCISAGSGFTGGYCVYGCAVGSELGDLCGADSSGICLNGGSQLVCYRLCTPGVAGQCRSGYICLDVTTDGSAGICYANCALNPGGVCGAQRCDTATGECSGGCASSATCSTGSTCNTAVTPASCQCGPTTNCGAGRRCYAATGRCGCAASSACAAGNTCDTATGTCI